MKLRPRRREDLDVPIAPLIDVVFLLLIFFMVTTTFDRISTIQINLPAASNTPQEKTADPVELGIDATGRFYLHNQLLINTQLDTLKNALNQALGGQTGRLLLINADAQTPHQAVVTALDAARQVGGFSGVSLATKQPSN